jgi:hypothetical protein
MQRDIFSNLPSDKMDVSRAMEVVRLGYPKVEPLVPKLLEWCKDGNWPVARVFFPFLATIGAAIAPYVKTILASGDDDWKFFVLQEIVAKSTGLRTSLKNEIEKMAENPSVGEKASGVDEVAKNILMMK